MLGGGGSAIAAASAAPSRVPVARSATLVAAKADAAVAAITRRQAIAIARKRVPGARVTGVEREWEHGRRTWEVELRKGGTEYDVHVSAESGEIVKFDEERDDRHDGCDDHNDDHDDGDDD